jgi:valine--pyruvate aminotransferase
MRFSKLGTRLTTEGGVLQLMRDLGQAIDSDEPLIMLGGGNPAQIPEVMEVLRQRVAVMAQAPGALERVMGVYDGPRGDASFLNAVAALLNREFGWSVTARNIAVTNGSQSAFFYLFNLFGGTDNDGVLQRIFLPMAPEYMGYAEQGLEENLFVSRRPKIELRDGGQFKYRLDSSSDTAPQNIAAVCVSRPTNPTGNVLTASELDSLSDLARERDIPLIIDNAYGTPFPDIIFGDARPVFNEQTIVCMSLSKLGMPGLRTGIVVASEGITEALGAMNAVVSLATNSMGPAVAQELFESGEVVRISREVIRPFYQRRAEQALGWLRDALGPLCGDGPCRIHTPEGAFFLWLWCDGLPITSAELYERLRARGVIVVGGQYFFPGLEGEWRHRNECIRINYSQDETMVRTGLKIIGEEVKRAYAE